MGMMILWILNEGKKLSIGDETDAKDWGMMGRS